MLTVLTNSPSKRTSIFFLINPSARTWKITSSGSKGSLLEKSGSNSKVKAVVETVISAISLGPPVWLIPLAYSCKVEVVDSLKYGPNSK
jgi:hypothetical protein